MWIFKNSILLVKRTLLHCQTHKGEKYLPKFQELKTKVGKRTIPMLSEMTTVLKLLSKNKKTLQDKLLKLQKY